MKSILLAFLLVTGAEAAEMLVCGWDEVMILDLAKDAENPPVVWRWSAAQAVELPEVYKTKFRTTDDCKAVAGNRILITASSDGVALVDRATKKTSFYGQCANAHSAELLPGERIAVACSVREKGGNRLAVFDAKTPEREIFSTELYSGHGVVWDEERKTLWALSGRDLRAYSLDRWESETPALRLVQSFPLPTGGGHELLPIPGTADLAVTTVRDVYRFNRERQEFSPHSVLQGQPNIKSLSYQGPDGPVVYTQAEKPNWWTDKIRMLQPSTTIVRPGEKIYKVRWIPR